MILLTNYCYFLLLGRGFDCTARHSPCTPKSIARNGGYYFPHRNRKKFIQCGAHGQCFVKPCAPGTVWNHVAYTCTRPCTNGKSWNPISHICD